jgi:hypothetical protein
MSVVPGHASKAQVRTDQERQDRLVELKEPACNQHDRLEVAG